MNEQFYARQESLMAEVYRGLMVTNTEDHEFRSLSNLARMDYSGLHTGATWLQNGTILNGVRIETGYGEGVTVHMTVAPPVVSSFSTQHTYVNSFGLDKTGPVPVKEKQPNLSIEEWAIYNEIVNDLEGFEDVTDNF